MVDGTEQVSFDIDFNKVHKSIVDTRKESLEYLKYALCLLIKD